MIHAETGDTLAAVYRTDELKMMGVSFTELPDTFEELCRNVVEQYDLGYDLHDILIGIAKLAVESFKQQSTN